MPSVDQIILGYQHPHVATYINDNTMPTDNVITPLSPIRALQVFTSSKGRDNKILEFDSVASYINEYGNPNYALYGQAGYMPYSFLSNNLTKVYCLRVMPSNASYSNLIVVAKVKVVTLPDTTKQLSLKYIAQTIPNITVESDLEAVLSSIVSEVPDANGYLTYPVFMVYSLGRGLYGNNFRMRLTSHSQADLDNEFKNYRVELFSSENGLVKIEGFETTLYPLAISDNLKTSYFIEDVVGDKSTKINCVVYQQALTKIFNMYKTQVDTATTYTEQTFDMIFGINKNTNDFEPKIAVDIAAPDAISLDRIDGVSFASGNDGAFSTSIAADTRADSIDAAYISALKGEVDPKILSKRRVPCELIMDAGYSDTVKRELINLILKRYDAYGFIDGGLLKTTAQAIDWAEYMKDIGDRVFSKECQHFKIKDPFNGKIVPMTMTYFLANRIPSHFKIYGNYIPFVGEDKTKLLGFVKSSLLPIIDADDLTIKESLYNYRVNYYQALSDTTFVRGTQVTSQYSNNPKLWSDLSDENNMHVLLEMKRIIEDYVASKLFNFAEITERKMFVTDVQNIFESYAGSKVRSFEIKFDMNAYEESRSILHCYLAIVFRTIDKNGIIEIDINKRV